MGGPGSVSGCRSRQAPRSPSASERGRQQRLGRSGSSAGPDLGAQGCRNVRKRLRLGTWSASTLSFCRTTKCPECPRNAGGHKAGT